MIEFYWFYLVNIDGGDEIGVGNEGLKRGRDITKLSQKKTKVRRTGTLLKYFYT